MTTQYRLFYRETVLQYIINIIIIEKDDKTRDLIKIDYN